ncbi:MAG: response regulator [Cytophagales bacterium]|nr:MAG: response regulator [Cytophagales bacterium]
MKHSILIIDDEEIGASNLLKSLKKEFNEFNVEIAYKEDDINTKIHNNYFNIAIVDLRMDNFSKGVNGFTFINQIISLNPFAKIIIVSAFLSEYIDSLNKILSTGRVEAIIDKDNYDVFVNNIKDSVLNITRSFESNPNAN